MSFNATGLILASPRFQYGETVVAVAVCAAGVFPFFHAEHRVLRRLPFQFQRADVIQEAGVFALAQCSVFFIGFRNVFASR